MRSALLCTVALVLLSPFVAAQAPVSKAADFAPYLGVESRAPTPEEAKSFDLKLNVRHRGQVIASVHPKSPAERAGLRIGDVLIGLDDNDIYSFDDIRDFVATSVPGRKVVARLKRAGSTDTETITSAIGKRKLTDKEAKAPSLTWHYSSLVQLETVLARSKSLKKSVLVGISGAET